MKKNLLICGSSKNLGMFLAKKFKSSGYNTIKISKKLKTNFDKKVYNCDLEDNKECELTLKKIFKKYKNLDAIIFTVGNSKSSSLKLSSERYMQSLKVNLITLIILIENYLKVYKKKNTQFIIISSIAGSKIINAPPEYSVSKSALNYFCKIKAKEVIKYGIKINIISPGNIYMKNNVWGKKLRINKKNVDKYIDTHVPSKKFVKPEEIFLLCELLIRKNQNYVGSNFILDGGQSL